MIQTTGFLHAPKHLAGLFKENHAFLRDIRFLHRHHLLLAVDGEGHRRPVQHIARGRLHLHQLISPRFQRLRQHEPAGGGGVKGVQLHRLRVGDVLGDILSGFQVANPEPNPRQRNDFPRFRVLFHHLQLGVKGGIVDEVAVHLPLLIDIHVKGREKLRALPAFGLLHRIHPIGQPLAHGVPEFIRHQSVPFAFPGLFITASTLEEHLKHSAHFRCLNLCAAVVVVLQDGNAALDDALPHSQGFGIVFHRVLARLHAQLVFLCVQLIPRTGCDLLQRPSIPAGIPVSGKSAVSVSGVHFL